MFPSLYRLNAGSSSNSSGANSSKKSGSNARDAVTSSSQKLPPIDGHRPAAATSAATQKEDEDDDKIEEDNDEKTEIDIKTIRAFLLEVCYGTKRPKDFDDIGISKRYYGKLQEGLATALECENKLCLLKEQLQLRGVEHIKCAIVVATTSKRRGTLSHSSYKAQHRYEAEDGNEHEHVHAEILHDPESQRFDFTSEELALNDVVIRLDNSTTGQVLVLKGSFFAEIFTTMVIPQQSFDNSNNFIIILNLVFLNL